MKTTTQKMVVHLAGYAPVSVDYFFAEPAAGNKILIDLHLHFLHSTTQQPIQLVETVQRSATDLEHLLQIIIAEIVREQHLA